MFKAIKKLVAAVVGLAVIVVHQQFDIDITGMGPALEQGILAVLTAFGVYQVRNDEPV